MSPVSKVPPAEGACPLLCAALALAGDSAIAIVPTLLMSLLLLESLLLKVPAVVLASLLLLRASAIAIVFRRCWCPCCC
jgi:hypothetical protein